MKKILITGGGGYIGSVLSELLLKNNFHVTILDNFMYGQVSLNHLCNFENLKIIKGDVRDEAKIKTLLKKSDVIIPLAALVGAPICNFDPVGSKSINYDSLDIIFKNKAKEQIILMPTTNSAYGSGDTNNYCDENSQLKPISNYAKAKVDLEKKLMDLENTTSFRLATVFGMSPRMRTDLLVNDFVLRAFNDRFIVLFESQFKRNYIHVRDVAHLFLYSLNNYFKFGGVSMSGNGNIITASVLNQDDNFQYIYLSSDIGATWKKIYNDCIRKYFPTSPNILRAEIQSLFF